MNTNEQVILIHGFLGASWNLKYHENRLKEAGLNTFKWGYPSREKTIQEHAADLTKFLSIEAAKNPNRPIHFVTHSLGGLILRAAINDPDCPKEALIGRAVLLTPPNQGTQWGRAISKWKWVRSICKNQSGKELLTAENFDYLGNFPSSMKVKVIAGNLSFNPFLSLPNDSLVTVEETSLKTPHEHIVLFKDHFFILLSGATSRQIIDFINAKIK